ncbi:MAG: hypothetical protein J6Q58_02590, partial [Clostridia bacterium]|nr:hypothetical protein [Clostridia bacterium]
NLSKELNASKQALKENEELVSTLTENIKDQSIDVSSTNEFISKIDNELHSVKSRLIGEETSLRFYTNLKESFGGYNSAVKNLMTAAKNNSTINSKIKGVVASIVSCDKKYENAIQTAIGGAMQNVVTADPQDAEYLINFLKKTEGGRVTFLPVTSVKPRYNSQEVISATKEAGALGLATELVKYDGYYENVISFLLGGTLICEDLQKATIIARKYKFQFKIVTLDGDVLSQTGSMTGGSKRHNDTNLLAVDRSVKEFTEAVNKDKAEVERLEINRQELLDRVNQEVDELDALKLKLTETRQYIVLLREKINSQTAILNETESEIEKNKDEIALITNRLNEIKEEVTDYAKGDEEITKEKEDASKEQSVRREKYSALKLERDNLLKENTDVQSRLSYLHAEISASEVDKERINGELVLLEDGRKHNVELTQNNEIIIKELSLKAEKVALPEEDQKKLQKLRSDLNEIDEKKVKLNEMIVQDNLKRDVLQADINKSTERKNQEEINFTKVDAELEFMSQNIFTEYQLTYETCIPFRQENYDISMSRQDIATLKRKIAMLGNINPNAIEEYNELSASYNELLAQRDDLVKAQEDLQKVIDDLTKEMTLTFNEGFKTIRSNFTKIFKELFGGGTADLVVEESLTGDPLDAGIEIVAEPPGKKLQKISLLSGGEMSLTAIAILFAILKLRPMPFCVLDEIEAALDDANVDRFAKYLRNFSKETQFICITHKKVTMEHADGLFGVTMPEKGVSSIVSVRLSDVASIEDFKN